MSDVIYHAWLERPALGADVLVAPGDSGCGSYELTT